MADATPVCEHFYAKTAGCYLVPFAVSLGSVLLTHRRRHVDGVDEGIDGAAELHRGGRDVDQVRRALTDDVRAQEPLGPAVEQTT